MTGNGIHYLKLAYGYLYNIVHFITRVLRRSPTVTMLIFHQIHDLEKFDRLIHLLNTRYQWIDPKELDSVIAGTLPLQQPGLMVSFDDGFYAQYLATKRTLTPLGIKAFFFVNPPFISHETSPPESVIQGFFQTSTYGSCPDAPRANMTPEDIQELASQGHQIGAHTWSHKRLNAPLTDEEIEHEIVQTNQYLSTLTRHPITHMAIPFGTLSSICPQNLTLLRRYYTHVFSSIRGHLSVKTPLLCRQNIDLRDPLFYCKALASGLFIGRYGNQRKRVQSWHN